MPEVSLFLDREDERSLVQFIFAQGGRLVSDLQSSLEYEAIREWDAFASVRNEQRLFFVLFDLYDESPLRLRMVMGGHDAGKYYVMQRVGGPVINLLTSVQYRKDDVDWVSGGGLSYYPTYENTITGEMEQAPDALVKQYNSIVSHLKKMSKSITGQSGRKYLIGPHTYQLIEDGEMKLGVQGLTS